MKNKAVNAAIKFEEIVMVMINAINYSKALSHFTRDRDSHASAGEVFHARDPHRLSGLLIITPLM